MKSKKYLSLIFTIILFQSVLYAQLTCNIPVNINLNFESEYYVTPEDILEGNFNNYDTLWVVPDLLTCADIGTSITIAVHGIDENGNEDICWTNANIQSGPLQCSEFDFIYVGNGPQEITLSDIFESGTNPCLENYDLNIFSDEGPLPADNIFDTEHIGYTYLLTITSFDTGDTCSFYFEVLDGQILYNVCVKDYKGIDIANTMILPNIYTDNTGCATITADYGTEIIPTKSDLQETAVDLLDIAVGSEGILAITPMEPEQFIAGNVNYESGFTGNDLNIIQKMINGTYDFQDVWKFIPSGINYPPHIPVPNINNYTHILSNNYNYDITAIKMGDIDGSYSNYVPPIQRLNFLVKDILLKEGETYTIPIYLESAFNISVIQMQINLSESYEIVDIFSNKEEIQYNIKQDIDAGLAEITWMGELSTTFKDGVAVSENETLLNIEIKAKENCTLSSSGFGLLDNMNSKLKEPKNTEIKYFKHQFTDLITVPVHDEEFNRQISIYPNPATSRIFISFEDENNQIWDYKIYDLHGRTMDTNSLSTSGEIELKNMNPGMYYIELQSNEKDISIHKLIVE